MSDNQGIAPGINRRARRIDTHHHVVPPFYRDWLQDQGITAGGKAIPEWSPESALEFMDATGVETAILSVSTPGVEPGIARIGDDRASSPGRDMARRVNEYAAEVSAAHPGRFGFFATLTLPDIKGAISEAAYALDELEADGVVLLANTDGVYLGDSSLEELMAELDRRSAVVFVHPSHLPAEPVPGIAPYVADFLLDTTRAALKLAASGTMDRYENLRVILSHGGGFVPYAAARMSNIVGDGDHISGLATLRKFYFDTALTSATYALPSLMAFADPERILYGSDFPYAVPGRSSWFTADLDADESVDHAAINRGNAVKLLPQLALSETVLG